MINELELAQLLDQFVDDLDDGVMPRIYELMDFDPEVVTELIPLLDLAAWFKVSSVQMPANEKERVKAQVLEAAQGKSWSMRRLVEESDPQVVAKGTALGFAPAQMDAVSSDTTPFDLDDPSEVVNQLAKKHKLRFFDLLSWVNQLISSVLRVKANSSMSMVYARGGERKESDESE